MPRLREVQEAITRGLLTGGDESVAVHLVEDGIAPSDRLMVYRNTMLGTLTNAMRLSYPTVQRLVGAPFFESAVSFFVKGEPPQSPWLDAYGARFPDFLAAFAPSATLPYLPGVARLEWAVSRALHAEDAEPLDPSRLAAVASDRQEDLVFVPHPAIALVTAEYPVDEIWRAVLAGDDAAMAAIDLAAGPARLLVGRRAGGIELRRCNTPAWDFAAALFAGRPLGEAIAIVSADEAPILLADHFANGRFIDCRIGGASAALSSA